MKRIIVLFSMVLGLQGLNSFGQTNTTPSKVSSNPRPESQGQKEASKSNNAGVPAIAAGGTLSHDSEQGKLPASHRVKNENKVVVRGSRTETNYGAALEGIFRSQNDQMGETSIRDTVVTIFPTGR